MLKYISDLKSVFQDEIVVVYLLPLCEESSDFSFCSKINLTNTQSLILRGEHTCTPNNCLNLL